jgi:hypothetical protein
MAASDKILYGDPDTSPLALPDEEIIDVQPLPPADSADG